MKHFLAILFLCTALWSQTTNLGLTILPHGSPNWDTATNANWNLVDAGTIIKVAKANQAITGGFNFTVNTNFQVDPNGNLIINPTTAAISLSSTTGEGAFNTVSIGGLGGGCGTAAGICWITGLGSPEGAITAHVGSIYSDGNALGSVYYKNNGVSNTGWLPLIAGTAFNPASPVPIGNVTPNTGSFTQLSVTALGVPTQLVLTPSGTSQVTVTGAAVIGVPNTITTPGAYLLPAAPATGILFGTNSSGIEQFSHKTLQGTGTNVLSASTVSGLAATLCTDATGAATTAGCGAGGGTVSGLTGTKVPVASSATTLIDSSLTDTGGLLSTTNTFKVTGNAAASSPGLYLKSSIFTGGSGTTTFPYALYDAGATAPTTWSTNGTMLGINAPSAFSGNLIDIRVNGSSSASFQVNSSGSVIAASGGSMQFSGRSRFVSGGDGLITATNNGGSGLTRFNLGLSTSSGPALCVSGAVVTHCLGDGTAPAIVGLGTTTVAALPAAAAGNKGQMIAVSDSTTISAEGQTCVGSSTNTALAFSNGTVWKCF